tara:strand:- start:799 stop:1104 length:306 start_codon:yes stop_codon:yes gene_type:complete
MSDKLKNLYISLLEAHDWNYENHSDYKYDIGDEEKMKLRSIIAQAYEIGKDPARLFYQNCPEHLYKNSADYGIRTPWNEMALDQAIKQEIRQENYKKNVKH